MATTVLLRLAAWTGEGRYREAAERALGTVSPFLARYPTGFAQWLVAASFAASDAVEVAIVGDPADPATRELLGPVWSAWRPNQVLAVAPADRAASSAVPLLHDRVAIDGRADGLRLPQLRLQPAGHRRRRARGTAPRDP